MTQEGGGRPLLTERDAREVLDAHFRGFLSSAKSTAEGLFSVQISATNLGGVAGVSARIDAKAISTESFEGALRDLAARRPDLVFVPINDASGLFLRLCHQRARSEGLFPPRTASLTLEDCDRLDTLNNDVPRLREALRRTVDWSSWGPAGFLVVAYAQGMLHRVVCLIDGAASAWSARNGIASAVLARAVLETLAVWAQVTTSAERHLEQGHYDDYDKLISRLFFGKKTEPSWNKKETTSLPPPIHVLDALRQLEERSPGVGPVYDDLSQIAHPNGDAIFALSHWQSGGEVHFDPELRSEDLLGNIVAALRTDIALACIDCWERVLAPKIGAIVLALNRSNRK